ncbi:MAG: phospholipid carrier-dependent glycosyltransferase, partial [Proteobacteria bacterium]|nr:phospholipid carrier-dependent glycosyltransferase [Pseudomonadota bacterium]
MAEARAAGAAATAILAAAGVLYLAGLGGIDLWAPDEPRYGQIAAEITEGGHGTRGWWLLHLNGEPYTQKPPLYYWLVAGGGRLTDGVSELVARLPSALAAIAVVAATAWLGVRAFGPFAGWVAAGALLCVFRFSHLARRAQLDVLLAAFEAAALVCFWRLDRGLGSRRANLLGLHAALGAAVLTKGPVGLLPLAVMAVFLVWEGRLGEWRRYVPYWSWALSAGPALAWLATAVTLAPPGFFETAVVENLWGRFAEGTSHARPFYYYVVQLPADLAPVSLLAPFAVLALRRRWPEAPEPERRAWRFLAAWLGTFFVFFSLSAGKRGLYLTPAYPAAVLACTAPLTARWAAAGARLPRSLVGTWAGLFAAAA